MPTAIVTGASRGLGAATADALAARGFDLVVDARDRAALTAAAHRWTDAASVRVVPGDVSDPNHRRDLMAAATTTGRLDVLINNASTLGPSPRPPLREASVAALRRVLEVNVLAPLALIQASLEPLAAASGAVVNVTSDVATDAVAGWGGYATSKAALEHLTAVLAVEEPAVDVYTVDPGDLRTAMHQAAFPDEDISDRPEPQTAVPALLAVIDRRPPSGRYRVDDLLTATGGAA